MLQRLVGVSFHNVLYISQKHCVQFFFRVEDWVDHAGLDIRANVVHIAMLGLIGSNRVHEIQYGSLFAQLPVRTSNRRCSFGAPLGQFSTFRGLFNGLDNFSVGRAGFFLDVSVCMNDDI